MFKILLLLLFVSCSNNQKFEKLEYYQNGRFVNKIAPKTEHGLWGFLKWQWTKDKKKWPESVPLKIENINLISESEQPIITFINHSTFLIQVDGINILTDPVFSKRTSPVQWAGPKRVIKPGVKKENIPKIDIIIISHNHYDHLDYDSLIYFKNRDNSKIYAGLEVAKIDKNLEIQELKWWEEVKSENFLLSFTPCQHFSGRSLWDRNESLWGGFFFKSKNLSFYFAGDTGYSNHFKEVKQKYGDIDIAFIPIGAYEPRWFMKYVHMNPAEAVLAHNDLNPGMSLGMHWGTFQLTDEARMTPVNSLKVITESQGISNFKVMEFGESLNFKN